MQYFPTYDSETLILINLIKKSNFNIRMHERQMEKYRLEQNIVWYPYLLCFIELHNLEDVSYMLPYLPQAKLEI